MKPYIIEITEPTYGLFWNESKGFHLMTSKQIDPVPEQCVALAALMIKCQHDPAFVNQVVDEFVNGAPQAQEE